MKKDNAMTVSSDVMNVIAKGAEFIGNINIKGNLRVDGLIQGDVTVSDKLVVDSTGKIKGNIKTKIAIISGDLDIEKLQADKVEFLRGAKVQGDIICRTLKIEEGVIFNGKSSMGDLSAMKNNGSNGTDKK